MQLKTGLEGALDVFGGRVSRYGNGRDSSSIGVEGSDALVAILRRHPKVGDDDVREETGRRFAQRRQRFGS